MHFRHWVIASVLLVAACSRGSKGTDPVPAPTRSAKLIRAAEPVPGSYVVAMNDGLGAADATALAARHGATVIRYLPAPLNLATLTLPPEKAIALAEDAAVKYAEEDSVIRVAAVEWNLDRIDQRPTAGDGVFSHATTGAGVHVYVLDTGVTATHPELNGRADEVAAFASQGSADADCNGHGTHVAGIAAGLTVGVAPGATVHAVRVAGCDGTGELSDLAAAVDWVKDHHATPAVVIIGTTSGLSPSLDAAIHGLLAGGVTIVGPAGNAAQDACGTMPAASAGVLAVGATTYEDAILATSNRGRCVELFAPGALVRSAWNDGGYRLGSGTSQAAAHVAGAAALFLEARPSASPTTVADALLGNATLGTVTGLDAGSPNRLLYTGFITATLAADTTAPDVAISAPSAGSVLSGTVTVAMSSAATDLASVAVYVDGSFVGADATLGDGLSVPWPTDRYGNGIHVVTARAFDGAGNVGQAQSTVTVANAGNALYDPGLQAPACAAAGERCGSGTLLAGRGPVGPEASAPNTIQSLCADGIGGTYQLDESVESIAIQAAVPGHPLAEGDVVNVDVGSWGYPDFGADRVDLYFARDAGAPVWEYAGTAELPAAGAQTVRFTYRLPAMAEQPLRMQQAVRATIRYGGSPAVCSDGPYDDHDDLAFAVGRGIPDVQKPTVAIVAPGAKAVVSGAVNLDATASDLGGGAINRVELYVDGALVGTAFQQTGSLYRVPWNADTVTLDDHTLLAVAYDTSGNSNQSDPVTVTVKDLAAPAVAIDSPLAGAAVGGLVRVWAIATDNRSVTSVKFFAGGELAGEATTPPWAIDWSTVGKTGSVTFVARASDGTNTADSSPITVTIDNVPPTVAIAYPAANAEVSGLVQVRLSVGNDAIDRVEVFAGGQFIDTAVWDSTVSAYVVDWNTGRLQNGPVTLSARAFDTAGNSGVSLDVPVVVNDTEPPTVTFLGPAAGAHLRGTVQVGVDATDNGVVTRVEFKAGASSIGTDTYAPYQVAWDTTALPDGQVVLTATGFDMANLGGTASRTVTVDNHGPTVAVTPAAAGPVSGTVVVTVTAVDLSGVDRVDLWAGGLLLGRMTAVTGSANSYSYTWTTTDFDNRSFALSAVATDLVGNVSTSPAVTFTVSNHTTAEYDATLKAPACAASAAWCYSGTLLSGAGPFETNAPNTLAGSCADGTGGAYQQSESIEALQVSAASGSLAPGAAVSVRVRYWAMAANEADQIDLYHAADANAPAWQYIGTVTPAAVGLNENELPFVLPTGPLQAVRANFRFAQPGPDTCPPTSAFGDRDDLVFAVGSPSDNVNPVVTLDAPAAGGAVGGDFVLLANATDNQGIARVEFLVDGVVVDTVLRPDGASNSAYSAVWAAGLATDGAHDIQVTAYDTSGNSMSTQTVTISVSNLPNAVFDTTLGVPLCSVVASFCDTAQLLEGRGTVGPEANAPNTLGATCADGNAGVFHQDESLDRIRIYSTDGLPLASGKRARVEARVWAYSAWGDDALDLYYTSTPNDPHWIWFATLNPAGPGSQTLTAEYTLPPGGLQAVRGRYRFRETAAACGAGPYDDHDDVAFGVQYTPNGVYDATLMVPACATVAPYCDSGALLDGRGTLGPEQHAPNTLGGTCVDGTLGTYHVDPSIEGLLVRSDDMTSLKAGQMARVEVSVYASGAYLDELVELFTCSNPSAATPVWTYLGAVAPDRAGSQVIVTSVPVTAGTQAIRAHLSNVATVPAIGAACGTTSNSALVDDQDDLVFTAAP